MINDADISAAFKKVKDIYGLGLAKTIECLFRNETAHFKSGNFLITLSPGMQATQDHPPFGWSSLAAFWSENPSCAPTGIHIQNENTSALAKASGPQKFMTFPDIMASVVSVAELIHIRGGNAGTWFSLTDKILQDKYNTELSKIIPRFCNKL